MRMKKTKRKRELQEGEYGRNCRPPRLITTQPYDIKPRNSLRHDRTARERERKNKKKCGEILKILIDTLYRRKRMRRRTAMKEAGEKTA